MEERATTTTTTVSLTSSDTTSATRDDVSTTKTRTTTTTTTATTASTDRYNNNNNNNSNGVMAGRRKIISNFGSSDDGRRRRSSGSSRSSSSNSISPRLLKAQRLLYEFQMDAEGRERGEGRGEDETTKKGAGGGGGGINGDDDDDDDTTQTQTTTRTRRTRTTTASSSSSSSSSSSTTTSDLPDSFWSNGHLQEGRDYVTRWSRGVKVAEPLVRYDPIKAEKLLFRQPTKWFVRNIQIALPLSLWVGGVVLDFVRGVELSNRRNRAKQLLKTLTGLGPAIIKGGQALASRPDLMPSEYLEELQKLQDDVPRFSNDLAFATVEEELNMKFNDVFELVENDPVAAASIGQVYKARLISNGDLIAIKIQRPKCEEIIALDLYVLRWWSGIANIITNLLNRDINVQSIIDDFGTLIYRELDYVAEAANAQRFTELYAGVAEDVFVPKVYSDLTTSKVLTMEWIDGLRLTDPNLESYGLDRKKLVDTLVQCSLRQILENGFFHADPHAGNLLACEDGRLCYLDFGMMSYAAAPQRNGFLLAVVHIVNRDWAALVRLYQRLGFIPQNTDLYPIEIALEKALPDVLNSDISEVNFKNIVNSLGDIMYTYPFSLPPFYIAIIRCLGVLEGLAIQVDPKARVISEAYPYVASRVLTDSQDDLQEALRRLALTNDGNVRWDRLEGLLDKAKESRGYDVTAALDQLTDYLLSNDGEVLLYELIDQIVDATDSLSYESIQYIIAASQALIIRDEVAAVRAFKGLQSLINTAINNTPNVDYYYDDDAGTAVDFEKEQGGNGGGGGGGGGNAITATASSIVQIGKKRRDAVSKEINEGLQRILPNPTPAMVRFSKIIALLSAQAAGGASGGAGDSSSSSSRGSSSTSNDDFAKYIPLIRKLSQEPKVQKAASEIIARLGERFLSRSLRALFGLPPPIFDGK